MLTYFIVLNITCVSHPIISCDCSYAVINFSAIIATWGRLLLFNFSSVRASESMFEHLLDVIMNAPMSFFDT